MKPYIHSVRHGVHIIDLQQTVGFLENALKATTDIVAKGGRVLFVSTKPQACTYIRQYAEQCGQYYVDYRWLGGMLTNWKTISKSIDRLKDLKKRFDSGEMKQYTKKEQISFEREYNKLGLSLGGIKDMGNLPDLIFVIDTNREAIAILEAKKLSIPVIAVLDTNSDPEGIDYPIPGNDDAIKSIELYCQMMSKAILEGIKKEAHSSGIDVGASLELPTAEKESVKEEEPKTADIGDQDKAVDASTQTTEKDEKVVSKTKTKTNQGSKTAKETTAVEEPEDKDQATPAGVTAEMVKTLRTQTGAGMMDCKKALTETGGNLEEAKDWLRKKGLSAAAKKADRQASEGCVGVQENGTSGLLLEVNSETDFVARNKQFQDFALQMLGVIRDHNLATIEDLKAFTLSSGPTVEEALLQLSATIGERLELRRIGMLSVSKGVVVSYVHNMFVPSLGKLGVLVALESEGDQEKLRDLGRRIAMHIAAAHPLFTSIETADPEVIERERSIIREQTATSGKPENVLEKMLEGRMRKYFEEIILEEQSFVMDPDRKIKTLLEHETTSVGAPIKITGFLRFKLGEGIEKSAVNFAEEVANQLGS
eukprot:g8353.t1